MSDIYECFNNQSVNPIVNRPMGGSILQYSWSEDFKKDGWKVDGYLWRFCGSAKERKCGSGLCDRMYFQIYDGPKAWSKWSPRHGASGHQEICCKARQSMFALRVLVSHGLHGQRLFDVVRATTIARLLYASPVWWGFAT